MSMGIRYSFTLLTFTRFPHPLFEKHSEVQVMQVFLCLWCFLIHVVFTSPVLYFCSLLLLLPKIQCSCERVLDMITQYFSDVISPLWFY